MAQPLRPVQIPIFLGVCTGFFMKKHTIKTKGREYWRSDSLIYVLMATFMKGNFYETEYFRDPRDPRNVS